MSRLVHCLGCSREAASRVADLAAFGSPGGLCVEGGIALATALRTTKALTLLDLRDNALLTPVRLLDSEQRDRPSDARAVRALVAALRINATLPTPLTTLRLDNNGLGPTAVERLRRAALRGSEDAGLKLTA